MYDRTILSLKVFLVTLACLGMSTTRAAEPTAIVTDLRGEVRLASGGAVALLAELGVGAVIVLQRSAHAVLVHVGAHSTFELAGPGSFVVRADGVAGLGGSRPAPAKALSASFRDVRLRPARIAQASISMRGGTSGEELRLVSPVATWLIEPRKRLRWESHAAATSYAVQLTDSENRILYETTTHESATSLPERVRLEPGRLYGWQVRATMGDGRVLEAWTEFGVADAALLARVNAGRPGPAPSSADRIAFALLLEALNLREAARDEWARVAHDHPSDPQLRALAERR